MKRNKYLSLLALALTLVLSACNKILDDLPDSRTEIDSPEKIEELLVGAYPNRFPTYIAEMMSDNVSEKTSFLGISTLNTDMYFWRDNNEIDGEDNTPTDYWIACYAAIGAANQALESYAELGETARYNYIKGEALVARAYAHFMLAYLWCKPYNEATAATDLGLAYVTEPEKHVFGRYTRIPLKEYYDAIERDLTQGLPLLDDSKYKQPRFHFTTAAAHAFATRFYLMKAQWDKVIEHADAVLGANAETKLRNIKNLNAVALESRSAYYTESTNPSNILVGTARSALAYRFQTHKYSLTLQKMAEICSPRNTHPLNFSNISWEAVNSALGDGAGNIVFPKSNYYYKYVNRSAGTRVYYSAAVLFSYDEVYLNRLEAYLMSGNLDQFRRDLFTYLIPKTHNSSRPNEAYPFPRMTFERYMTQAALDRRYQGRGVDFDPSYPLSTRQREWLQAVVDIRRVEFVQEGLRWFDNKRLGMKVVHKVGDGQIELTKEDPRRELQIPNSALEFGMAPNPR